MKIGITINEVLRDFIGQFAYTYDRYVGPTDIKEGDVTSLNLLDFFKFKNIDELNKFLYLEQGLEIFGHADQLHDNIMNQLNFYLMDTKDDGEHQIEIVSREIHQSIPATFFFLSKTACRAENIRFVQNYTDEWNGLDVLITADPIALENKPSGKISVKVNASYNKEIKADYEIDSLLDFMKDENLRNKILNSKITTYEEIK